MIKTVYGPPPAGEERIEVVEVQTESGIWEDAERSLSVITTCSNEGGQQA